MVVDLLSAAPILADAAAGARATRANDARKRVTRRRFVGPATCERDCSEQELGFLAAIQEYKRTSGRMFPTWSEVLEVVQALGYTEGQAAGA